MNAAQLCIVRQPGDRLAQQRNVERAVTRLEQVATARGMWVHRGEQVQGAADEDAGRGQRVTLLVGDGLSGPAAGVLTRAGLELPRRAEALALAWATVDGRPLLAACGFDARGLGYAVLELADRVEHSTDPLAALKAVEPTVQQPANRIRSIARPFESDVEDRGWFADKAFWWHYLANLATQRFNRFSLTLGLGYNFPVNVRDAYFYFAYPFFVDVPGYAVGVPGLGRAERERNLELLRFIGEEAAAWGLHFQLALWTHTHHWTKSPHANYNIHGLSGENHAAYCRDALQLLLEACPHIGGLTFRVHGESGIEEGSYSFWRTVFEGIVRTGRSIEIDMHAKGVDRQMIDVALATGMPVLLSPKYWAEHMGLPAHQGAIRGLEQRTDPAGGTHAKLMAFSGGTRRFTRYGYGDFLREDRPYGILWRLWPGTQRHLLWADAAMAAGYGRYSHFCDSDGIEICEPLSFKGRMGSGLPGERTAYADPALRVGIEDWRRYELTYRTWGRRLYDPDGADDAAGRWLKHEFGRAGEPIGKAVAFASRILPLLTTAYLPSASNNSYWPEMYTSMPIVLEKDPPVYRDTPQPWRAGAVSPLDTAMFCSGDDCAGEVLRGRRSARYSPLDVAAWLDELAGQAEQHLAAGQGAATRPGSAALRRVVVDVQAMVGLGRFFAGKLRAIVAHALFRDGGHRRALEVAVAAYEQARQAWQAVVTATGDAYRDDITYGQEPFMRGHWADRVQGIDEDLAAMKALLEGAEPAAAAATGAADTDNDAAARLLAHWPADAPRLAVRCEHAEPEPFQPGQAVVIAIVPTVDGTDASPVTVRLHYRHVDQSKPWQCTEMMKQGDAYRAEIPADDTDSPYPLMYFLELAAPSAEASLRPALYPGLDADLSNQPYFIVRQQR